MSYYTEHPPASTLRASPQTPQVCDAVSGESRASTRSSNFETPSAFEMKSTPMAAYRESATRSVYIVNRMTGVSGISSFRIVAASAPFNRRHSRIQKKSGRDFLAFSIASTPSTASRTFLRLTQYKGTCRSDVPESRDTNDRAVSRKQFVSCRSGSLQVSLARSGPREDDTSSPPVFADVCHG
jgi:hypothetical protein